MAVDAAVLQGVPFCGCVHRFRRRNTARSPASASSRVHSLLTGAPGTVRICSRSPAIRSCTGPVDQMRIAVSDFAVQPKPQTAVLFAQMLCDTAAAATCRSGRWRSGSNLMVSRAQDFRKSHKQHIPAAIADTGNDDIPGNQHSMSLPPTPPTKACRRSPRPRRDWEAGEELRVCYPPLMGDSHFFL